MEDTCSLAAVVLVVCIVRAAKGVQSVVDSEVPDVVVPSHHLAEFTLVVLDVIFQTGDSVVDVREVAHVEGAGQEGPAEREPGICAVQAGRYVVEVLNQVAGIPVVVD